MGAGAVLKPDRIGTHGEGESMGRGSELESRILPGGLSVVYCRYGDKGDRRKAGT